MSAQLIFGKYELIRRLAVGGMGEIFLARQKEIVDRLVILKSLLPDLAENRESVDQFLDEARVAATLNHPNIVAIYEVGMWEGVYFIAMEYIHGENVGKLMQISAENNVRVPIPISARLVHDASIALHHAHTARDTNGEQLNVVHRDISPQNIMVRTDGVTKVVDFGIAKATIRSTRTATGILKGKLRYMPPEQLRGKELDGRSDQFSLGVVFWELLTSRRLFRERDIASRLSASTDVPPSSVYPGIPQEIDEIALRMLKEDPNERFESCEEVVSNLTRYLETRTGESGTNEVARHVSKVVGESIEKRTADLRPTGENFFISLGPDDQTAQAAQPPPTTVRPTPSKGPLLLVLVAMIAVAIGLATVLLVQSKKKDKVHIQPTPPARAETPPTPPPPETKTTTSTLTIQSDPTGATVKAGETILGVTPLQTTSLAPQSRHLLQVELNGYLSKQVEVMLTTGESETVTITLEPKKKRRPKKHKPIVVAPPAEKKPGYLSLETTPWTKVSIDGSPRGSTPIFRAKLTPGRHTLHLVNEGAGIDVKRTVTIRSGKTKKLKLPLSSSN